MGVATHSRLRFGYYSSIDGTEFWDRIDYPTIEAQPDDTLHHVLDYERLDLLASMYYGDPTLKWVIAVANNMEIEPTDLNPGTDILIPSPRWVNNSMFRKGRY